MYLQSVHEESYRTWMTPHSFSIETLQQVGGENLVKESLHNNSRTTLLFASTIRCASHCSQWYVVGQMQGNCLYSLNNCQMKQLTNTWWWSRRFYDQCKLKFKKNLRDILQQKRWEIQKRKVTQNSVRNARFLVTDMENCL